MDFKAVLEAIFADIVAFVKEIFAIAVPEFKA